MKKIIYSIVFLFTVVQIYSQTGVGIKSPITQFEINGDLRVRQVNEISATSPIDSIAVLGENGILYRLSTDEFFRIEETKLIKIFATNNTNQNLNTGSRNAITNWTTVTNISNATTTIWDATTGIFRTPVEGWYRITAALVYAPGISSSATSNPEFNVYVLKNVLGADSLAATTATFSKPGTNRISTGEVVALLKLNAGDKISIGAFHECSAARNLDGSDPKLNNVLIEQLMFK